MKQHTQSKLLNIIYNEFLNSMYIKFLSGVYKSFKKHITGII